MAQIATGLLDVLQSAVARSNDSGNAPVLLMLGTFKFSLNTAVFQQLDRSTEYRWARIEQFGKNDALQFTGLGEDSITLPGVIYPDWRGGYLQIDQLKALAATGRPQRLMFGNGDIAGFFAITHVRESRQLFKQDGSFRKQEFSVEIKYYGPNVSN